MGKAFFTAQAAGAVEGLIWSVIIGGLLSFYELFLL